MPEWWHDMNEMPAADLAELMVRVARRAGASPRRILEAVTVVVDACELLIRADGGQVGADLPPGPKAPERVVERAWRFVTMLEQLARSRDGSPDGHMLAVIARELRDCLNDDDTGGMALPAILYDDGKGPGRPVS